MSYVALFISEQKYLTHFCHQTELRKKQKPRKTNEKLLNNELKKNKKTRKLKKLNRLYLAFDEVISKRAICCFNLYREVYIMFASKWGPL